MSMQNIEHQGYGVDLGDFQSTTENFNEVIENLMDNDDAIDYINDNSLECVADTPVNSDGFSYLVYIPAVIPVTNNPHKIKPYTEEEAHEAIFKTVKDAIVANNLDKSLILNKTEAQFFIELREFIDIVGEIPVVLTTGGIALTCKLVRACFFTLVSSLVYFTNYLCYNS